jgi:hypothetical protein
MLDTTPTASQQVRLLMAAAVLRPRLGQLSTENPFRRFLNTESTILRQQLAAAGRTSIRYRIGSDPDSRFPGRRVRVTWQFLRTSGTTAGDV